MDDQDPAEARSPAEFVNLSDGEFKDELARVIPHLRAFARSLSGNRDLAAAPFPQDVGGCQQVAHLAVVFELAHDGLAFADRQVFAAGEGLRRADGPVVVGRQPGAHALEQGPQAHDVGRQGDAPSRVLDTGGDGQRQFRRRA